MKIDDLVGIPVVTTGAKSDTFGFGMDDPTLIFKILREKMYANPRKAAIQEYMCNARDAHREAGLEDRPVLVTFPDFDGTEIGIRDYGLGIPKDKMESVFCKYGASTKRTSDRFTGGWGLGCKTGFAIGESFSVISITDDEDGTRMKRTYLAYLDQTAGGSMSVLSEEETDEETGLQVNLPVDASQHYEYAGYLEITTRFWPVRPIVKGHRMVYEEPVYYVKGDKWAIQKSDRWNTEGWIILDGIRYIYKKGSLDGIELNEKQRSFSTKPFVLFFNTGELTPTPNREDITYDTDAKFLIAARLEEMADRFHERLKGQMDELFGQEDNPLALRLKYEQQSHDLEGYAPHLVGSVKSKLLPKRIEFNQNLRAWRFGIDRYTYSGPPVTTGKEVNSFEVGENVIYVLDDTSSNKPTRQRAYGLQYHCEEHTEYNPLVVTSKPTAIYAIRFKSEEAKKEFLRDYPSFEKLWHPKTLSQYNAKPLGLEPKKKTNRGGGTELRVLCRDRVAGDGMYSAFVPFSSVRGGEYNRSAKDINPVITWETENRKSLEEVFNGVYVVLNNGNCYSPDGHTHQTIEVTKPASVSSRRRRKRISDDVVIPTTTTRPVTRFPSELEVRSAEINNIPYSVPIYGVFEKGYNLIKDNPNFITVRDYHHRKVERFRAKYSSIIDKGRAFHYPLAQQAFAQLNARTDPFIEYMLSLPKHLLPSPELVEWWQFQKSYPNFANDLGRLFFSSGLTFDSLVAVPQQIALSQDNRLIWFASALSHGKMTDNQKREFLMLLHTNQMKSNP
jgi:hypothetical protein